MLERCPLLAENMYEILTMEKVLPLATVNCIEAIARGAESAGLQQALLNAGTIWRLIPHLLSYDLSLEEDVIIILRTQNIIYKIYADTVIAQKYPAYSLLLKVLRVL